MTQRESTLVRVALVVAVVMGYGLLRFKGLYDLDSIRSDQLEGLRAQAAAPKPDVRRARQQVQVQIRKISKINEEIAAIEEELKPFDARLVDLENPVAVEELRTELAMNAQDLGIATMGDAPLRLGELRKPAMNDTCLFAEVARCFIFGEPHERPLRTWKMRCHYRQLRLLIDRLGALSRSVHILGFRMEVRSTDDEKNLDAELALAF